jgi:hypothetical protein
MECNENIVPIQTEDFCNGKRYNTKCLFSDTAYTLLDLPANSTQEEINNALVLALNSAFATNTAQQLVIEDLEARILLLENP